VLKYAAPVTVPSKKSDTPFCLSESWEKIFRCHLLNVHHSRFPSQTQNTEIDDKVNIPYYKVYISFWDTFKSFIFQVEVFWFVIACSVVAGYRRFGDPCCLKMEAAWTFEVLVPCHNPEDLDLKLRRGSLKTCKNFLALTLHKILSRYQVREEEIGGVCGTHGR
jgi:hypothetical protein